MDSGKDIILVDLDDREIGFGEKMDVHRRGLLHRAFSVFLFDGDRLLVQKRAAGKYHIPSEAAMGLLSISPSNSRRGSENAISSASG